MGNFVVFYISFQGLLFIYAKPLCGNSFWFNVLFTPLPFYLSPLTANLSSLPSALTSLRFHLTINFYLSIKTKQKLTREETNLITVMALLFFQGRKSFLEQKKPKTTNQNINPKHSQTAPQILPFSYALSCLFIFVDLLILLKVYKSNNHWT